ncbi:MAG TPA: 3'(2'),5'-bisphosphate nucleotidase CysQ [Blastocatellia bacterium]|nr:3'(2'),5'-bisphosphate nucleotidase CysQ [Blastocatellia bacterium]
MERELEVTKTIAREAGRILMEIYSGDHSVEWKGYDDPVTAADHAANHFIVAELRRHFPDDGILSEEATDDQTRLHKSRVWLVDPMDGTKQFIERIGEFAVMIGLAVNGKPELGVVFNPATNKMYYATPSIGAYLEEPLTTKRLHVAATSDPAKMVAAMSRSHTSPKVRMIKEGLGITQQIESGSVGLKIGLLAEGRAHVYVHLGAKTNQWDTCAPQVIIEAAGGKMTDRNGQPLQYNVAEIRNLHGVVASNGVLHERVIEEIQKVLVS